MSSTARSPHADLYSRLDLERPELESVRDAVQRRDDRRARQALLDYLRRQSPPRWLLRPPAETPDRPQLLGRAQAILAHDFLLLNRRAQLGSRIDWRANPVGDREWAWALNRHEFFDDLVAAYRLTGDERYARELDALIGDWIRANPVPDQPDEGSDPWRPAVAGERVSGPWLRAWAALRESPSFRPETRLAMLRSFEEHAGYLWSALRDRTPQRSAVQKERSTSPDSAPGPTEIPAVADGLAHVGVLFPLFKEATAWSRAGVERLEAEMRRQVYADGGQIDLSSLHQQMAIRRFVEPLRLLSLDPTLGFSNAYLESVGAMLRWNMALARPDHTLPQLNDSDLVTLPRQPVFLQELAEITEPRIQGMLDRWRTLDFDDASRALPYSGLYVMRGASAAPGGNLVPADARYLCIDAGPLGAIRGHQDRLGLDLYAYGRSLLLDPGRYLATEAGAWFQSSAAHNTVLVDGQGQNRRSLTESPAPGVPSSRGEAATAAAANRWSSAIGIDCFEGSYEDGYGPSNDRAVKHVRQVLFVKPAYWVVWDRLVPDQGPVRSHRFEQLWHFPPGRVVVEQARQLAATEDERKANLALLPVTPEASVRVVAGGATNAGAEPLQGWFSPEYGGREAAPVAVYRLEATPPVLFETVLYPYAAGRRPAFAVERLPVTSGSEPAVAHQVSAFQFRYGGFIDLILAAHDPHHAATLKQAGDLRTDAEMLVLRLDAAGQPVRLLARAVSTIAYAGQTLFAADRREESVDQEISH